jgi:hypothetical protein
LHKSSGHGHVLADHKILYHGTAPASADAEQRAVTLVTCLLFYLVVLLSLPDVARNTAGLHMHCLLCRRYEKAQKPLSAFDADISKYADLSEEVLAENAAESIKFLFVDCGPLKQV